MEKQCEFCHADIFHCPQSGKLERCKIHELYNCFGCDTLVDPTDAVSKAHLCATIEQRFSRALVMRIQRKEGTDILFGSKERQMMYVYLTCQDDVPCLKEFGTFSMFKVFIYNAESEEAKFWFQYLMPLQACQVNMRHGIKLVAENHCSQCMSTIGCACMNVEPLKKVTWF